MSAEWIQAAIALIGGIGFVSMGYGYFKSRISTLEKEIENLKNSIAIIEKEYVTNRHFEQTIEQIREDQKEIKHDLKRIIDMLVKNNA